MQRFNRGSKGAPNGGQVNRPKGGSRVGQKKPVLSPKEVQALEQQKIRLENQMRRLLEQIRQSGESDLHPEKAGQYEQIGKIVEAIRRIDSNMHRPRFGTTKAQKKHKK